MITIKPISTRDELVQYFTSRRADFEQNFPEISAASISKDEQFEIDEYDLFSFHFGAFENGKLKGAARIVKNTQSSFDFDGRINNEAMRDFILEHAHIQPS